MLIRSGSRQSVARPATLVIIRLLVSLAMMGTAGMVLVEIAAGIAQAGWSVPVLWEHSRDGM